MSDDDQDDTPEAEQDAPNEEKFALVPLDDVVYSTLRELVAAHHDELAEARIALVWAFAWKPDKDDHLVWGKAKKVSTLEQQFHPHDFVIQLNAVVWKELGDMPRKALLDHELSHCGSRVSDQTGETTYCLRKHDVEEFSSIVRRYGLWRTDIESFVNAALGKDKAPLPLFDDPSLPTSVTIESSALPAVRALGDALRAKGLSVSAGGLVSKKTMP